MSARKTGYVYDQEMEKHQSINDPQHPEGPYRIKEAYSYLKDSGLLSGCIQIESRCATERELMLVHGSEYIKEVKSYVPGMIHVCQTEEQWVTYTSDCTYQSATCAVGSVLQMVDAICLNEIDNGFAIVRPPGHHAEVNQTCGFCYFNNVSIAAKYAQQKHKLEKVLIVDWDIHHGNGIQNIFYDDPSVLYISMHKFDNGEYFPHKKDADYTFVGKDTGEGYNVNIPWNYDEMGNSDYKMVFDRIILPIAKQFNADLVLVACGFDAAADDAIGEFCLTPEMYGYMAKCLKSVSKNGKILLSLEGGYSGKNIGQAVCSCVEVLLNNDMVPSVSFHKALCKSTEQTINLICKEQLKYWNLGQ